MDRPTFEEAVEFARKFRYYFERTVGREPPDTLAKGYRDATARRPERLGELIWNSGHAVSAWDGVNLIAQNLLRAGEPLPGPLAAWIADVLEDVQKPKAEKKRPRPSGPANANLNRNFLMATAILLLVGSGLHATRSGSGKKKGDKNAGLAGAGDSACDAVGMAFDVGGYKAVEKVWTRSDVRRRPFWTPPLEALEGILLAMTNK